MTLFSLIEIHKFLRKEALDAKIVSTVHDSIILEVRDDPALIELVATTGMRIMAEIPTQYIPNCTVPFRADVEVGTKWGHMEAWVA
jgi:DNA polymerase I-like protein with 3'-5' exonuclease and polymerase domains